MHSLWDFQSGWNIALNLARVCDVSTNAVYRLELFEFLLARGCWRGRVGMASLPSAFPTNNLSPVETQAVPPYSKRWHYQSKTQTYKQQVSLKDNDRLRNSVDMASWQVTHNQ